MLCFVVMKCKADKIIQDLDISETFKVRAHN